MAVAAPYTQVPGWLVGPLATTVALGALFLMVFVALALASVHMQTDKLRRCNSQSRSRAGSKTSPAMIAPAQERKITRRQKQKARRSKMSKFVKFFIGEWSSEDEDQYETETGAYEMDDTAWVATTAQPIPSFIIGDDVSPRSVASSDAFGLRDEVWR